MQEVWLFIHKKWSSEAYLDYVHGKQTFKQLKVKYCKSVPTIQKQFIELFLPGLKEKYIKEVNLVFDASYFGSQCCLLLFRADRQNLQFDVVDSGKLVHYEKNLQEIKEKYNIVSFTIDGRRGVIQQLESMFPGTPVQLCQYHFKKKIVKYTTKRPRSECGQEIYELISSLSQADKVVFKVKFFEIVNKYSSFLKGKNEAGQFKHRRLRAAVRSTNGALPYLFTYHDFPHLKIHTTTDICKGFFSELKRKVNVHPGLSLKSLIRILFSLISS